MKRFLFFAALAAGCGQAPAPPADQPAAATFESNRISVVTRGNGPDIILVPGLSSHRDVWKGTADSLEGRYRLHLVQVNGFAGFAPGANADGPVSAPVAEEIARYITETKLGRPAVIGHSMGGTIAMMLGARHPDLVGKVMVVDMPPFMGVIMGPQGASSETVRPVADSIRRQMLAAPPGAPSMFEAMVPTMTRVDSMKPMLLRDSRASHPATVANAFHELLVTDLRPELSRIPAPLTVLYVIPPNHPLPSPDAYAAAFVAGYKDVPGVRLIRIENSYHFIQFDAPGRLIAEVDAMMRG